MTLPIEQAAINCSRFAAGDFRVDAVIENIVERLSLEQTICAARWQVQTSLDLDHQSLTVSDPAGLVPTVVEYSNARAGATMEHAGAGIVEQPTQQTDKILLAHRTEPPRIFDRKLEL